MFHLIYATDGWCAEHNEPNGGRCVGSYPTLGRALETRNALAPAATHLWGPGDLVICSKDGRPLLWPAAARLMGAGDREEAEDAGAAFVPTWAAPASVNGD